VDTLDLRTGDLVRAGETVAVLNLKTQPYVRCYLPENRLGWVKPGQEVGVTVDSFPGQQFRGKVRRVSAQAEFTPRNVQTQEKRSELVFEMKVDVPDGEGKLRGGMYADVHIPSPGEKR
jgi:HlyD family secretion protein